MSDVWLIVLGSMAVIIGTTGGTVRLGGFRSGRRWRVQSITARAATTLVGFLLLFIGIGQFLGYGARLGITAATRIVTGPLGVDLLLIVIGLLSLSSAISVKSYIRAEDEATGVLKNIPDHRIVVFARVLTSGIAAVLLASGIWGLAHDLTW
jgi:hypothetical protein